MGRKTNIYLKQVSSVLEATSIHWPSTFLWFGTQAYSIPNIIKRELNDEAMRDYLVKRLSEQLYSNFYCAGMACPVHWGNVPEAKSPAVTAAYVQALSESNVGMGYWESGWTFKAIENNEIKVHRNGLELIINREECEFSGNAPIEMGRYAKVHFPKEFPFVSPKFYVAKGNHVLTIKEWQNAVRLYWNLSSSDAARFVRRVTQLLNQTGIPFEIKVFTGFAYPRRCDSTVLYLRKMNYVSLIPIIETIYKEVSPGLSERTPALTKSLAPGLGVAENPQGGPSFGLDRCRRLAEGMVQAFELSKKSLKKRLQVVSEEFTKAGIDLERPFLNPDSEDIYDFSPRLSKRLEISQQNKNKFIQEQRDDSEFIEVASQIGEQLCREAIWQSNRCNWIGVLSDGSTFGALRSDFYSGTAGVGLFLAQLYAATANQTIGRTAEAAIRQSLSKADDILPTKRIGLYEGWIGIVLASVRAGLILDKDEYITKARKLLSILAQKTQSNEEVDLISGRAGAIVTLLSLRTMWDSGPLLDLSIRLAEEMLERAVTFEDCYAWKMPLSPKQCPLTGLSHGAAGIAYALLELFVATGDVRYARAAELTFNYERKWFNEEKSNWPDLRGVSSVARIQSHDLPCSTYWCHGAPGIALVRLLAYNVLKQPQWKSEALIGLNTTRKMVERALLSGGENYSLCHGLAGNAEVLFIGTQMLGAEFSCGAAIAKEVADSGIRKYVLQNKQWPCGIGDYSTSGLMVGRAGIGYFYLRMGLPKVPSVLFNVN